MGSPNFYTGVSGLNVAIDYDKFAAQGLDPVADDVEISDEISTAYAELECFINNLPRLYWHSVTLKPGYHEGFQLYIEGIWCNKDEFTTQIVKDWQGYKYFTDASQNLREVGDCPYFNSNAVNITYFSLDRAIDKEYKTLHNLILEKAKECGLGEVIGSSWSSSVEYPLNAKMI